MITRLLMFLVVLCCFSFYSNAQELQSTSDGSITTNNLLSNSDFDQSVFNSEWNWWQDSNAGLGHVYATDKFINLKDGGVWQSTGLPSELDPNRMVSLNWQLEIMKNDLSDLLEVRVGFGTGTNDWSSVLDMENQVTQLHTWETFSGSEIFNSISSNYTQTGIWVYGKDIDGGSWASGDFPAVDDIRLNMTYFEALDCSNPLNDPSCEGYQQAYTAQQCQQDALYDPSCSGYDEAYENQQCSIDSLYSPRCDGYYQAYEEQQCEFDSQYSFSCPNYIFEAPEEFGLDSFDFEDFSGSDSGSDYDAFGNIEEEFTFEEEFVYEDPMPFDEPFEEEFTFEEEFVIEEEEQEILEEMFEEFTEELDEDDIDEESEENITPLSEINAGEISDEGETSATPRRSGSRVGLSVGLNTVDSLVGSLISRSIESGLSNEAQGVGSDSFYGSDTQNMANLAATGGNFGDFANNITSNQQNDTNIAVGIGAGPLISPRTSANQDNMAVEIVREPSLAEKMAEKVRKKNLDNQKGIFNKQITMLENMANRNNLNKYYDERLSDASDWYGTGQVYAGNRISDKDKTYYGLNAENYGTMQQLIRSQY